ncbi:alpha/beta hydrolase [SAR92 clade bacterium H246]
MGAITAMDLLSILLIGFVALFAGASISALYLRSLGQKNQRFRYHVKDPDGYEILEPIQLGGIEQWLHIRGRSKENPILLFLHGGPGLPHIGWFDEIQRPWEDYFTVVQWDQRQQGKSYASLKSLKGTINNSQMLADTSELIAYLRQRFNQQKIFLIGKSYGTYLGMHMASRHPEWLHAYIADGQITNVRDYINNEYQHLLSYAQQHQCKALTSKLQALSPRINPENPWQSFVESEHFIRSELEKIGKGLSPRFTRIHQFYSMITINQWLSPLLSVKDHWHRLTGDSDAASDPNPHPFKEEFLNIDLSAELGMTFDVPIFLFTGRHDWHVSGDMQREWFDKLEAPYKEQVWFEKTTHMPYLEEPGKYLLSLVNSVLPIAMGDTIKTDPAQT